MDFITSLDHFEEVTTSTPIIYDLITDSDSSEYSSQWHFIWTLPFHVWLGVMVGLAFSLSIIRLQEYCIESFIEKRVIESKATVYALEDGKGIMYSFKNYTQSVSIALHLVSGYIKSHNALNAEYDEESQRYESYQSYDGDYVPDEIQKLIIQFVGKSSFYEQIDCRRRVDSVSNSQPNDLMIKYDPQFPEWINYRESEVPVCPWSKRFLSAIFYICVIRGSALAFVSLVYGVVIAMTHSGYPWRGFIVTMWTIIGIVVITILWLVSAYCRCFCGRRVHREIKVGEADDDEVHNEQDTLKGTRSKCIDLSVHMDGHHDTVHLQCRGQGVAYKPLPIVYS